MECEVSISWEVTATKLQHQAWVNDISAYFREATLIDKPKQLPPPTFTEEDIKWMRGMHVKEPE